MTIEKDTLMPCPFCGEAATVSETYPHLHLPYPWLVSCDHLDACELFTAEDYRRCHATREEAVRSWNTRTSGEDR